MYKNFEKGEIRFALAAVYKKRLEKGIGYKGGYDSCDGKANGDILPDHLPFHLIFFGYPGPAVLILNLFFPVLGIIHLIIILPFEIFSRFFNKFFGIDDPNENPAYQYQ